jgi:hypothetical protein
VLTSKAFTTNSFLKFIERGKEEYGKSKAWLREK